jgi:hypothetical protein
VSLPSSYAKLVRRYVSMIISTSPATLFSTMRASWVTRGSCQNASVRPTAPAARVTGSRARTRGHQRSNAKPRKIGGSSVGDEKANRMPRPMKKTPGAQFEISIDGTPRTHRDLKPLAMEAAEYLKRKHPNSAVIVKDLQSGEATAVEYKPDLGRVQQRC